MTRPKKKCRVGYCPEYSCFGPSKKPDGDSDTIEITPEEVEALRLKNIKGLEQTAAAEKMSISQSTFHRILASAQKKMSEAIVYGKTTKIKKEKDKA